MKLIVLLSLGMVAVAACNVQAQHPCNRGNGNGYAGYSSGYAQANVYGGYPYQVPPGYQSQYGAVPMQGTYPQQSGYSHNPFSLAGYPSYPAGYNAPIAVQNQYYAVNPNFSPNPMGYSNYPVNPSYSNYNAMPPSQPQHQHHPWHLGHYLMGHH